jgi:hypothetical protein
MVPQYADAIHTASLRAVPVDSESQHWLRIPITSWSRKGSFFVVDMIECSSHVVSSLDQLYDFRFFPEGLAILQYATLYYRMTHMSFSRPQAFLIAPRMSRTSTETSSPFAPDLPVDMATTCMEAQYPSMVLTLPWLGLGGPRPLKPCRTVATRWSVRSTQYLAIVIHLFCHST